MLLPTQAGGFDQFNVFPKRIAVDKTKYIEQLDKYPKYEFMFLRPQHWGKSTFLQTLANYYDKSKQHLFNDLFRDFYIGKHPTSSRSSLLVLQFDFSAFGAFNTFEEMSQQFDDYMHETLRTFLVTNKEYLKPFNSASLDAANGSLSLSCVLVCRADPSA